MPYLKNTLSLYQNTRIKLSSHCRNYTFVALLQLQYNLVERDHKFRRGRTQISSHINPAHKCCILFSSHNYNPGQTFNNAQNNVSFITCSKWISGNVQFLAFLRDPHYLRGILQKLTYAFAKSKLFRSGCSLQNSVDRLLNKCVPLKHMDFQ